MKDQCKSYRSNDSGGLVTHARRTPTNDSQRTSIPTNYALLTISVNVSIVIGATLGAPRVCISRLKVEARNELVPVGSITAAYQRYLVAGMS